MRKNSYKCGVCKHVFVTEEVDEGVTPMMLSHTYFAELLGEKTDCEGLCFSSFYMVQEPLVAQFEWYLPPAEEIKKLSVDMRNHIHQGGLVIRKKE